MLEREEIRTVATASPGGSVEGQVVTLASRRLTRRINAKDHSNYSSTLKALTLLPDALSYPLAIRVGHRRRAVLEGDRMWVVDAIARRMGLSLEDALEAFERGERSAILDSFDACSYPLWTRSRLNQLVEFQGRQNLDDALQLGKGAVLYTSHIQGLYTLLVSLGILGYHPLVVKRNRLGRFQGGPSEWLLQSQMTAMERLGFRFVWLDPPNPFAAVRMINELKSGGIVVVLLDPHLHQRHGDYQVDFLGRSEHIAGGSAVAALATGAPLLHLWFRRPNPGPPYFASIGAPLMATNDIGGTVQAQVQRLEQEVRADPGTWAMWRRDASQARAQHVLRTLQTRSSLS